MSRAFSLAGFEVTLIGRFWVTTEGNRHARTQLAHPASYVTRQATPMNATRILVLLVLFWFPCTPYLRAPEPWDAPFAANPAKSSPAHPLTIYNRCCR